MYTKRRLGSKKRRRRTQNKKRRTKLKRKTRKNSYKRKRKRRKSKYSRKRGGLFGLSEGERKVARMNKLIDECKKKNEICQKNQVNQKINKCDCAVGWGLQKTTGSMYCKQEIDNNKTPSISCKTPASTKVGVKVNKAANTVRFLKGFSFK